MCKWNIFGGLSASSDQIVPVQCLPSTTWANQSIEGANLFFFFRIEKMIKLQNVSFAPWDESVGFTDRQKLSSALRKWVKLAILQLQRLTYRENEVSLAYYAGIIDSARSFIPLPAATTTTGPAWSTWLTNYWDYTNISNINKE